MNRGWTLVIGFAVLLLVALPTTRADEVSNAELLSRIEMLESQLEQRSQFTSYSMGDQETVYQTDLYGNATSSSACSSPPGNVVASLLPAFPPTVVLARQLAGRSGSSFEGGEIRTRLKPSPSAASGHGNLSL